MDIYILLKVFEIILYHGTTIEYADEIDNHGILLCRSQKLLDFSAGFYTTPDVNFAITTAYNKYDSVSHFKHSLGAAIITLEYDEIDARKNLKIKEFQYVTNRWAKFIAANRVKAPDSVWKAYDNNRFQQYDIVFGPTADGGVPFAKVLKEIAIGKMSINDVKSAMFEPAHHGGWGTQMSFHTPKALKYLKIRNILRISIDKAEEVEHEQF